MLEHERHLPHIIDPSATAVVSTATNARTALPSTGRCAETAVAIGAIGAIGVIIAMANNPTGERVVPHTLRRARSQVKAGAQALRRSNA